MPRKRPSPAPRSLAPRSFRSRSNRPRKPTGKELDLLLLAGCSCLLTVLYHPVANSLQTNSSVNGSQGAIAAQVSKVPRQNSSFALCLPPKREEIREDEEETT